VGFHQQIGFDPLEGSGRDTLVDEAGGWSGGFWQHRAEADVDVVGEEVCHAFEDDAA
jgi:hypothetical protein